MQAWVLDVDDIDESLIDDSWIDPYWNVQEEEEESSLSTENDDVLDDSVFLAEAPKVMHSMMMVRLVSRESSRRGNQS